MVSGSFPALYTLVQAFVDGLPSVPALSPELEFPLSIFDGLTRAYLLCNLIPPAVVANPNKAIAESPWTLLVSSLVRTFKSFKYSHPCLSGPIRIYPLFSLFIIFTLYIFVYLGNSQRRLLLHQPLLLLAPDAADPPDPARAAALRLDHRRPLVRPDHHRPLCPPHPRPALLGRSSFCADPTPGRRPGRSAGLWENAEAARPGDRAGGVCAVVVGLIYGQDDRELWIVKKVEGGCCCCSAGE